MFKRSLSAALTVLGFAALAGPVAAQNFDDRSIRGTWALAVEGFVAEGSVLGPPTELFAIGRVIFDGEGGCESDDQIVVGNVAIPEDPGDQRVATRCEYEVQPNGYGFFEVTFDNEGGGGATVTTARFIIEAKKKLSFIADNEELGIFGGGTLVRQSRRIN